MSRPLVLLDIDQTLIHTCPVSNPVFDRFVVGFGVAGNAFSHVRPNAPQLLRYLVERTVRGEVDFGFWSTGTKDYVVQVVNKLFELAGIPDGIHKVHIVCTREVTPRTKNGDFIKILNMLKRPSCLLVDDNALHAMVPSNHGKVLLLPPFRGVADNAIVWLMYALDYRFGWSPLVCV